MNEHNITVHKITSRLNAKTIKIYEYIVCDSFWCQIWWKTQFSNVFLQKHFKIIDKQSTKILKTTENAPAACSLATFGVEKNKLFWLAPLAHVGLSGPILVPQKNSKPHIY